jgi:(2R)-ethylmalonyl-CoA mutase
MRRLRYGVQVNSLGLTEAQPENNVQRHRARDAGRHPVEDARRGRCSCPAWNEALGLPRPWDQQWSLRMQQVLAYESDLLELRRHLRRLTSSRPRSPSWWCRRASRSTGCRHSAARWPQWSPATQGPARRPRTPAGARASSSGEEKVVGVNCFPQTEAVAADRRLDDVVQVSTPAVEQSAVDAVQVVAGGARRRTLRRPR